MKKLSFLCVAAAAILLASCATTEVVVEEVEVMEVETNFIDPVFDGSWESVELIKDGEAVTGATAKIGFAAPVFKVNGFAGVNNYFGDVAIDGTSFDTAENIGSTMMAGLEKAMAFERAYLDAFNSADKIVRLGDKLIISSETSKIVYTKNEANEWETTSVVKDGAVVTGATATLNITPTFAINGSAGVNLIFGNVTFVDNVFAITEDFGATKMLGTEEAQAFETAFLTVLPTLTTVTLEGDTLTISNETSKVVFKKSAEPAPSEQPAAMEEEAPVAEAPAAEVTEE